MKLFRSIGLETMQKFSGIKTHSCSSIARVYHNVTFLIYPITLPLPPPPSRLPSPSPSLLSSPANPRSLLPTYPLGVGCGAWHFALALCRFCLGGLALLLIWLASALGIWFCWGWRWGWCSENGKIAKHNRRITPTTISSPSPLLVLPLSLTNRAQALHVVYVWTFPSNIFRSLPSCENISRFSSANMWKNFFHFIIRPSLAKTAIHAWLINGVSTFKLSWEASRGIYDKQHWGAEGSPSPKWK